MFSRFRCQFSAATTDGNGETPRCHPTRGKRHGASRAAERSERDSKPLFQSLLRQYFVVDVRFRRPASALHARSFDAHDPRASAKLVLVPESAMPAAIRTVMRIMRTNVKHRIFKCLGMASSLQLKVNNERRETSPRPTGRMAE
ncbi:MAG TPA: hypothetical protein VGC09_14270 [Rhodopila sp.]